MRRIVGLTMAAFVMAAAAPAADAAKSAPVDGRAALERLKSLAGEWRGNMVTRDGPPGVVVYAVTAGGSAVTEKLFPGTDHEMFTLYHLDGSALVLTHYCAMGNQPHMRLVESSGTDPVALRFDFTGGTNIDAAKDQHMHGGTLTLGGADHLEAEWAVYDKGKPVGANRIFLERVKVSAQRP